MLIGCPLLETLEVDGGGSAPSRLRNESLQDLHLLDPCELTGLSISDSSISSAGGNGLQHLARALNGSSLGRVTKLDIGHCRLCGSSVHELIVDCVNITELRCCGVFVFGEWPYNGVVDTYGEVCDEHIYSIESIMKARGGTFFWDDDGGNMRTTDAKYKPRTWGLGAQMSF